MSYCNYSMHRTIYVKRISPSQIGTPCSAFRLSRLKQRNWKVRGGDGNVYTVLYSLLCQRVTVLYKMAEELSITLRHPNATNPKTFEKFLSYTTGRSASKWNPHLHVWSNVHHELGITETCCIFKRERERQPSMTSKYRLTTNTRAEMCTPNREQTFTSCVHCYFVCITGTDVYSK
jgi:hypothetical protein